MQTGPRDFDSVLGSRYWLTPAGIAAADQAQAAIEAGGLDQGLEPTL